MPSQDGTGLNNLSHTEQAWPEPRHPHQQNPVTPPQPETSWCSPQGDVELMPQKRFSTSSLRRDLNKSATSVVSKWRIASIAPDNALNTPHRANPAGWNCWEPQGQEEAEQGDHRR